MKNVYKINFLKLGVLMMPTFLRKPIMLAFIRTFFSQIGYLNTLFFRYKEDIDYRLTHNGQISYLHGVLNDYFDSEKRRIEISDADEKRLPVIYLREKQKFVGLPMRRESGLIISARGYSGENGFNFLVKVPGGLLNKKTLIHAVTSEYRLAGKQFDVVPL